VWRPSPSPSNVGNIAQFGHWLVTTMANFNTPDQQESIQPTMELQTDPVVSIVGQNESSEITLLQGLGLHSQTRRANSSHARSQRILRITLKTQDCRRSWVEASTLAWDEAFPYDE
jgi:hypothetical protein